MFKKTFVTALLITMFSTIPVFAGTTTVTVSAGDVILSKGGSTANLEDLGEGLKGTGLYKQYIIFENTSSKCCFALKAGDKQTFSSSGTYTINGDFEIID